jgi:hypothetical protein
MSVTNLNLGKLPVIHNGLLDSCSKHLTTFQVLSRNNDSRGTPYRLTKVTVFDSGSKKVLFSFGILAKSSMPKSTNELLKIGCIQLSGYHLSPSEFNDEVASISELYKDSFED